MPFIKWNITDESDYDHEDTGLKFCASIDTDACYFLHIEVCGEDDKDSVFVDEDLVGHIWKCVEDDLGEGHMRMSKWLDFSDVSEFLLSL